VFFVLGIVTLDKDFATSSLAACRKEWWGVITYLCQFKQIHSRSLAFVSIHSYSYTRIRWLTHIALMKIYTKRNRQGDWIAFLSGALLNMIFAARENGWSDAEWMLLIAGLIGGIVWLLGNWLYQWIKIRCRVPW